MKHKRLNDALNEVSDKYLEEAARGQKRKTPYWLGSVAAILAIALLWGFGVAPLMNRDDPTPSLSVPDITPPYSTPSTTPPHSHFDPFTGEKEPLELPTSNTPYLLSGPAYPKMAGYGTSTYYTSLREIRKTQPGYADSLAGYFEGIMREGLTATEENAVLSPVNIYLALAMLAETAEGNSRQQILDLTGTESITALRQQAEQVWRANYWNDGLSTSILASSLWLSDSLSYNESVVKTLAENYYASVFRGQMGSKALDTALQDWLDTCTGKQLSDYAGEASLSADTIMALATAIYYQVEWQDGFFEKLNTEDVFHGPAGDKTVTYMNDRNLQHYYWGEGYSAVALSLKNGNKMWLILPDEGKTPADLLGDGHAVKELLGGTAQRKNLFVNLALPKFDISAKCYLKNTLSKLGITDVFSDTTANFSGLVSGIEAKPYVTDVEHAARVTIDEDGVTAAAYTLILVDGAAAPDPDQKEIDFTLDRPFLFVIESDNMPLFAGVVNDP